MFCAKDRGEIGSSGLLRIIGTETTWVPAKAHGRVVLNYSRASRSHMKEHAVCFQRLLVCCLLALLFSFPCFSFPTPQNNAEIRWNGTQLGVHAEGVPLSQILRRLATLANLEIRGFENANEAVSVDFSNLSLGKGLETLLTGTDYALILPTDFEKTKPGLLLIFGRHARASQQGPLRKDTASGINAGTQKAAAVESLEVAVRQIEEDPTVSEQQKEMARLQLSAVQRDSEALKKALADRDPLVQGNALEALVQMDDREALDALIAVIRNKLNPGRTQALEFLDQARWADEGTVLSVLGDALKDEDVNIRGLAVQALANRDNLQAMDLLERALSDSDPAVRLMVVQSVAQKEAGFPLLEKAAGDQDEGVRSSAEAALKSLDSSRE